MHTFARMAAASFTQMMHRRLPFRLARTWIGVEGTMKQVRLHALLVLGGDLQHDCIGKTASKADSAVKETIQATKWWFRSMCCSLTFWIAIATFRDMAALLPSIFVLCCNPSERTCTPLTEGVHHTHVHVGLLNSPTTSDMLVDLQCNKSCIVCSWVAGHRW